MAPAKSPSALQSQIFEIIVGPSEQSFFAHAGILSKSKVLKRSIEGPWIEAQEKKIRWPDRDVDTAARFLEWLYSNDYTYPYPSLVATSESGSTIADDGEANTQQTTIVDELRRNGRTRATYFRVPHNLDACPDGEIRSESCENKRRESASQKSRKRKRMAQAGEQLRMLSNPSVHPLDTSISLEECTKLRKLFQGVQFERWAQDELQSLGELDYEAPLMAHARLYAMASHFMLDNLLILTWQRVFSLLVTMGPYRTTPTVIGNLITLIRYVYSETNDLGDDKGSLRDLVTKTVARHYKEIRGDQFDEFVASPLGSDRQFGLDLTAMLSQEIDKWEEWEAHLEGSPPRKRARYTW